MAEDTADPIDGRCFHFKVGDPVLAIPEIGQPVDQVGLSQADAQDTTLGPIKSRAGNSYSLVEAIHEMFQQGRSGRADIRIGNLAIQLRLGDKSLEQFGFLVVLFMTIKVQEVVDSQSMCTRNKSIDGNIFLQGAGGAQSKDIEGTGLSVDGACLKVDICEGVEFVHDDIDIIGPDTGGEDGKAFGADETGMGYEFAVLAFEFDVIEILADFLDAAWVTDGNDGVGKFFGTKVEVIDGAPVIKN